MDGRVIAVVAALLLGTACPGMAQGWSLDSAARTVRSAWFRHDAAALSAAGVEIMVELPGTAPAPAVDRAQAAALLRDYLAGTTEVEVAVRSAREIERGVGYVELARRFRPARTQELRSQRVLLGFRRRGAGWDLVELRVLD